MRLFVDTNIIIEYIEHRLQYDAVRKIRAQWGQAPLRPLNKRSHVASLILFGKLEFTRYNYGQLLYPDVLQALKAE